MERNLMVAGFGGQGVMTLGKFLASAACDATDKQVTFFPSYGAEQRGGTANCYVVISDEAVGAPIPDEADDLIVMNEPSLDRFLGVLKKGGILFLNSSIIKKRPERDDITVIEAPVTDLAIEMENPRSLNIIMLGVYIGYTGVLEDRVIRDVIAHKFAAKPAVLAVNEKAFEKGLAIGKAAKKN